MEDEWWLDEVLLFSAVNETPKFALDSIPSDQLSTAFSIKDDELSNILHEAARCGNIKAVTFIANKAKNLLHSTDRWGSMPIHIAINEGHCDIVSELIRLGTKVDAKNFRGSTTLHYAAARGELKVAQLLLENGAKINARDEAKATPLHKAAVRNHLELCEFLLKNGAMLDAVDQVGQTPLTHAVIRRHKEVVLFLICQGADMSVKEEYVLINKYPSDFLDDTSDIGKQWELKVRQPNASKKPRSHLFLVSRIGPQINSCRPSYRTPRATTLGVGPVVNYCADTRRTTDATTLEISNTALTWYNAKRMSGKIERCEYELVQVLGGTMLSFPSVYHCNFIARPKNRRNSEAYLFFAEVKNPIGNLVCTVCCMLGRTRRSKTGLRGCIICKDFPGLIQHPRRKNAFTKWN